MARRVILIGHSQRAYAKRLIDEAAPRSVVTFAAPRRSTEQNSRMWAMISDVRKAQPEGRQHTDEVWKCLFMHSLGYESAFAMGLNGEPFPIGFRSSRLSVEQMSDLIEVIYEYGARHGVVWSEPERKGEAA